MLSQEATKSEEGFNAGMKRIENELGLPCVLKVSVLPFSVPCGVVTHSLSASQPIRGRGSHGVAVVHNEEELRQHSAKLFKECPEILAEEFLNGEEITIAIMPPGKFDVSASEIAKTMLHPHRIPLLIYERQQEPVGTKTTHWTLPIVIRSQHINDITPYNGVQPVAENSAAIRPEQYVQDEAEYSKVEERVRRAGEIMGTVAVGRIDCRRNQQGEFKLFDVNMKPVSSAY